MKILGLDATNVVHWCFNGTYTSNHPVKYRIEGNKLIDFFEELQSKYVVENEDEEFPVDLNELFESSNKYTILNWAVANLDMESYKV